MREKRRERENDEGKGKRRGREWLEKRERG